MGKIIEFTKKVKKPSKEKAVQDESNKKDIDIFPYSVYVRVDAITAERGTVTLSARFTTSIKEFTEELEEQLSDRFTIFAKQKYNYTITSMQFTTVLFSDR